AQSRGPACKNGGGNFDFSPVVLSSPCFRSVTFARECALWREKVTEREYARIFATGFIFRLELAAIARMIPLAGAVQLRLAGRDPGRNKVRILFHVLAVSRPWFSADMVVGSIG